MFFRHASNDRTQFGYDSGTAVQGVGERGSLPHLRINDAYTLDFTSTLSPTTILNWRVSYNSFIAGERGDKNAGFDMTTPGFPQSLIVGSESALQQSDETRCRCSMKRG